MMVDHPGIFIQAHHAHVGHDTPMGLMDKVAGNGGILGVELPIGLFYFFLVGLNMGIFFGVDKTRFKKETG